MLKGETIEKKDKVLFFYHYSYGEVSTKKQDKFIKPNIPYNKKEYIYRINKWVIDYQYFNGLDHHYSQGLRVIECYAETLIPNYNYASNLDSDGNIKMPLQYYFLDKDHNKQGKFLVYYSNRNVLNSCFYKDGTLEGEDIHYYYNGNISSHCFNKRGRKEGVHIYYYESGMIHTLCFYKKGVYEGAYTEFYKNGRLKVSCFYKGGEIHGKLLKYDKNETFSMI